VKHPLQDLYDQIPELECQGHCAANRHNTCCGPIGCSVIEAELLEAYDGIRCGWMPLGNGRVMMDIPRPGEPGYAGFVCPHLGLNGRCEAYEVRPMICRLWGTTPRMKCPWGCKPKQWLPDERASELLEEAITRPTP
jgi:Fe-S-cluster containining protein